MAIANMEKGEIALTTNIRRSSLPSCLLIAKNEGGLNKDSVALCHQIRVLDKVRLSFKNWTIKPKNYKTIGKNYVIYFRLSIK